MRSDIDAVLWRLAADQDNVFSLEVDGRRWHARFRDFDRDARRDLHTLSLGYRTAHVTWAMLEHDPEEVCADLLAARRAVA